MCEYLKFNIGGAWLEPAVPNALAMINPVTEAVAGHISISTAADVDRAATAARKGFAIWSQTRREERLDVMQRIVGEY